MDIESNIKPYTVVIINEPEISYYSKILSEANTQLIETLDKVNRVIVIMLYGQRLDFIAEMIIKSARSFAPKNGVKFNKPLTDIIQNCANDVLKSYLRRLNANYINFTEEQKWDFVEKAMQYKSYKKPEDYKFKVNAELHQDKENQLLYIDSPITQLLPQIMELQETVPFSEKRIISQNPNVYVRVLREIAEVNAEFLSLRTIISPSTTGKLNVFNFVMFPNDGAFCSLPLIGRIIIPQTYPKNPPVFHLFTRTNRYNLDVFNYNAVSNRMDESSICFDIVKPIDYPQSGWKSNYTITTVVASIMDAIVSYKVQQMYGGEKEEFVTMESLESSYSNVKKQVYLRIKELNKFPQIPVIKSVKLMCEPIHFPIFDKSTYIFKRADETLVSEPLELQSNSYRTVEFQLMNLTAEFVLSFILTNNPRDVKGVNSDTVIFRNGVTATGAKKLANQPLNWFYHGKPLNSGDMKINLTITPNQFAMSYIDESTNGNWVLHGDTPLTSLRAKSVGNISKRKFNLVVYVRNKNLKLGGKFILQNVKTNIGYIHSKSQFQ